MFSQREADEQRLQFFTRQILEREENLRQLISHAPDAIIVINQESIIQLWNPMAEQIFGWKMEEVVGSSIADTIIPAEYHSAHFAGMKRLLQTGESHILNRTVEVMARNKDNQHFYISLTISSYQIPSKRMFIAFLRDISKQKLNEFELDQRRKQLERSNEELEQFAWLTSHDLKEPLRKIMTFSDMLMLKHHDKLSEEAAHFLTKIHGAADRMGKLIEAILIYSNISHERQLYESIDLNAIIREVINDLEISMNEKKAQINVDPLPVIEAIPFQMRQLFQNLLSNALKYVQPGVQPKIKISNYIENGFVKISIRDNGIGFENIYAEKIFQVFQRLESADKFQGTGIGLAVCKKIVENHEGRISAESEPGKGTEFIVELPLSEEEKN
ncbi:MAG TPA: ATP-binding protein [Chitinophagaceae bacterium]|nr:ATP-binding protein [Chitinophagaceae bacterium]